GAEAGEADAAWRADRRCLGDREHLAWIDAPVPGGGERDDACNATMPSEANIPRSSPSPAPSALPAVAPTKKIGVTIPPLPPASVPCSATRRRKSEMRLETRIVCAGIVSCRSNSASSLTLIGPG